MAVSDPEDFDGDPVQARDALAAGEGFVDSLCPPVLLKCGADEGDEAITVQALVVKDVDGRLVLAVAAAEVAACSGADRGSAVEGFALRVWFGLVEPAAESSLEVSEEPATVSFGSLPDGGAAFPFVPALVAAVNDNYTFASAESGLPSSSGPLAARLDRLERLISNMSGAQPSEVKRPTRAKVKASPRVVPKASATRGSLDPSVAAAAKAAGVPPATLAEFASFEPAREKLWRRKMVPASSPPRLGGKARVPKAEANQAELFAAAMFKMMEGYSRGQAAKSSALERGTPRHDDLREALLTSPADISSVIERLMQEDMASSAPGVGVAQQTSARAWLEHRSRVGPFAMNLAWSAAGALDALKAGLVEQARARLNVMLMVIDQMSVDRGSWTLAQELTLDLPPPVQAFKLREHASSSSAGQAYSRLLDSRWAEVSLTHLREQMVSQSAGSSFKRGRLPTRTKRLRPRPEKEPQPPPGGRQESRRSSDPEQLHASALAC
ncbi:unnamed protein product [Symbiodinium microadriaticum]|nr:unnamed protein product [Symbiodinium microadriaticum]